jgi:hypothetical protein
MMRLTATSRHLARFGHLAGARFRQRLGAKQPAKVTMERAGAGWHTGAVPAEVLHTQDHARRGARAFLRLEITDSAAVVIVHEHGPPRGADDETRGDRWSAWVDQLSPPVLTDDLGTIYAVERRGEARGWRGNPRTDHLPMKATVAWRFVPKPDARARRWTVDDHWTVERRIP